MADDVLAVLDGLKIERAHLIGHALGGLIGLSLALKAPNRLTSLIAVNAWAKLDSHTRRCFETRLSLLRGSGPEAFIKATPIFLYPAAEWMSSHTAQLEQDRPRINAPPFPARRPPRRASPPSPLSTSPRALSEITTPVLSLASQDDMLIAAHPPPRRWPTACPTAVSF